MTSTDELLSCPACGGQTIIAIEDYERNLRILRCDECGESYAVNHEDIYNLGTRGVMREWHDNYNDQKRLTP